MPDILIAGAPVFARGHMANLGLSRSLCDRTRLTFCQVVDSQSETGHLSICAKVPASCSYCSACWINKVQMIQIIFANPLVSALTSVPLILPIRQVVAASQTVILCPLE